ncbi:hypothetical protein ACVWWN_003399 [Mycobacterium sp. URHB0021]|jgi:hypothetical protein
MAEAADSVATAIVNPRHRAELVATRQRAAAARELVTDDLREIARCLSRKLVDVRLGYAVPASSFAGYG